MDTATESPHPVRTVGVEEELLLVDTKTGAPRSVASQVLRVARERGDADARGGSVGPELQQEQIETDTPPEEDLGRLAVDLGEWRDKARAAAAEVGALVLASGTAPLPAHPQAYADPRYAQMTERFGLTASEQLACGCHVHVSVASDDEAVGALDRIRVWLPALLAVSANSPFWQGVSSGYDSYRSQLLTRWPTNGPTEIFGTGQLYRDHLQRLIDTGVLLDEPMPTPMLAPLAAIPPSSCGWPMCAWTSGTPSWSQRWAEAWSRPERRNGHAARSRHLPRSRF
jgi:carboxylate-amine ligase